MSVVTSVTFCRWHDTVENPKDATRKLLELINGFSKVIWYKINTQKFLALLYTNSKKSEREIKETPIHHCSKKNKYLGINLPGRQNTCEENDKTMMKEIKDNTNRWRDIPCSWIWKWILWTWLHYSQIQYNLYQITNAFYSELEQNILWFLFYCFANFIFILKNMFQEYSIMIWYLCTLQSDHYHKCSCHISSPSPNVPTVLHFPSDNY